MRPKKELNKKVKEQIKKILDKLEREKRYEEHLIKKEKINSYP